MKNWILYVCISTLYSCNLKNSNSSEGESYIYKDEYVSTDCTLYAMVFKDGDDYLFKFSPSGKCSEVTSQMYLEVYRKFIVKNYKDKKIGSNKKIICEFYTDFKDSNLIKKSIINLTEKELGLNVKLKSEQENRIEISVIPHSPVSHE